MRINGSHYSFGSLAIALSLLLPAQLFGQFWGGRWIQRQPRVQYHQQSPQAGTNVASTKDQGAPPLNATALIIAVRDYASAEQLDDLPGTNLDADRMKQSLQVGGFAEDRITVVYDDAPQASDRPTRRNIQQHLDRFLHHSADDELAIIMTTGHGISIGDQSYFCPSDATDAALADADLASEQLISVMDLAVRFSSPQQNRLLIIDACRNRLEGRNARLAETLQDTPDGVWIISSCSNDQVSYMSPYLAPGERRAIFSHTFGEALRGEADLLGNNNGEVSLFEAYSYAFRKTQQEAAKLDETQTPEIFASTAAPFRVGDLDDVTLEKLLSTDDPAIARRQSARALAYQGNHIIRRSEQEFRTDFMEIVEDQRGDEDAVYAKHHDYVCYALGNYLKPAIEIDPECRLAHLSRGWAFRSAGMYAAALQEYRQADEPLELFVKGRYESIREFLAFENDNAVTDDQGAPLLNSATPELHTVPVYARPAATARTIGAARAHAKVRVVDVGGPRGEWLKVTAVNDTRLPTAGWMRRENTHWFSEAADVYTPSTPLSGGHRLGGGALSRADHVASQLDAVAARLALPAQRIRQIGRNIGQPIANINQRLSGLRSIPFIGGYVPYVPNYPAAVLNQAAYWADLPSGYVRSASGYVRMPAGVARSLGGWASTTHAYFDGHQRSEARMTKIRNLEPVRERQIAFDDTPWRAGNP